MFGIAFLLNSLSPKNILLNLGISPTYLADFLHSLGGFLTSLALDIKIILIHLLYSLLIFIIIK